MGVQKLVEVACDYRDCEQTKRVIGGTLLGAWVLAESAGWVRRGVWILCPEHANADPILR